MIMPGKMLFGSVALGLLISWLPVLCGTSVLELLNWSSSLASNAWKSLNSCFTRHILFFIVNTVVLMLRLPYVLRFPPRIPEEDHTAKKLYRRKLQKGQIGTIYSYCETSTTDSKRRHVNIEREDLASASAESDQIKYFSNKPQITDHNMPIVKFGRSAVDDHNSFVKEELDHLREPIEAFTEKVRRQMMLQERQRFEAFIAKTKRQVMLEE